MQWGTLLTFALVAHTVHSGMLRFSCSQLSIERLDPLVNPGMAPSPHLHQIVGGNAFNATMKTTDDIPALSTCTTCTFSENFSNYWTANLYYRAQNGTLKLVPQMANQYLQGANGGTTVYYVTPDDGTKVKAFPPGFRMFVGDATLRKKGFESFVNSYRCYTGPNFTPNPQGISADDTNEFPKRHCPGGIRVATFFPTCWDGKNLDSPNHKSHVAYAMGACPKTHPVAIPQVFLETVYNTGLFEWPADGKQPFLWSQGDTSGYSSHADYIFGWKGDSLQKALDANCNINCPQLKTQSLAAGNKCTKKQTVVEDLQGWIPKLHGSNPITP